MNGKQFFFSVYRSYAYHIYFIFGFKLTGIESHLIIYDCRVYWTTKFSCCQRANIHSIVPKIPLKKSKK